MNGKKVLVVVIMNFQLALKFQKKKMYFSLDGDLFFASVLHRMEIFETKTYTGLAIASLSLTNIL